MKYSQKTLNRNNGILDVLRFYICTTKEKQDTPIELTGLDIHFEGVHRARAEETNKEQRDVNQDRSYDAHINRFLSRITLKKEIFLLPQILDPRHPALTHAHAQTFWAG